MAIRNVVLKDIDAAKTRVEQALKDLALKDLADTGVPQLKQHKIEVGKRKLEALLIDEVSADFVLLNKIILEYNRIEKEEFAPALQMLREIYQIKKQIECKYPPDLVSNLLGYKEAIHVQLFEDLKQEFASLGIHSMHQDRLNADLEQSDVVIDETVKFPEILANMSPDKVSMLLEIFSAGALYSIEKFIGLYGDEDTKESIVFKKFLSCSSIEFLGGANSKNFKIKYNDGNYHVLKIDNRLNTPKNAEAHLRENSLRDWLAVVHTERQSTYVENNIPITRSLLVVEYCQNGDLLEHSRKLSIDSDPNSCRIRSALNIYGQMAAALKGIQDDGCVFTDMKNTNWLIDNQGRLRIADTKSFVFTTKEGNVDFTINDNRWYSHRLFTAFMCSPEMISKSADKLHAFMLGKNLYQYLTKCESSSLLNKSDGTHYDFSASIFHSVQGRKLEKLIKKLIKPKAADRMGVQDAFTFLDVLQENSSKIEREKCMKLLRKIEDSSVDNEMEAFVKDMANKMQNKTSADDFIEIQKIIKKQCNAIVFEEVNSSVIGAEDFSEVLTEVGTGIATEVVKSEETEIATEVVKSEETEIATKVVKSEETGIEKNKFQQIKRKFKEITSDSDLDKDGFIFKRR